jgi:phosphatidylglycerol---prolipoprotein diacylglyceryl transferase
MYIHNLNPVLLSLGPLEVRWYGLVYVLGFLLIAYFLKKSKKELKISDDNVWDYVFYVALGVILGARLFEIFWNPSYFLSGWNILKIWEGGMSFHGGLVGAIIANYYFAKKHKIKFMVLADIVAIPAIFILALGRLANFINGELWGRAFDGDWCVNFKNTGGGDICRHPSVLYAAVKRFLVFFYLLFLSKYKEFKPGFLFWNLVFFEGLGRIFVDFYREDTLHLGFSVGQWFSLVMVIAALYAFYKYYRADCKKLWGK